MFYEVFGGGMILGEKIFCMVLVFFRFGVYSIFRFFRSVCCYIVFIWFFFIGFEFLGLGFYLVVEIMGV